MPDFPVHHQLPKPAQTHGHWVGDAIQPLILCHPLLLLPSTFPSIRLFASGGQSTGASASVFSMNIQGWLPFRVDWFDLLAVQGIFKSLLQHHSSKASVLWHSAFFTVQLSQWYMTMLFNTLSRSDIASHLRRKHLLISCLKLPSAVILEPKKIKSVTVSTFFPPVCHEVMGPDAMILAFQMLSFKSAFFFNSMNKPCYEVLANVMRQRNKMKFSETFY